MTNSPAPIDDCGSNHDPSVESQDEVTRNFESIPSVVETGPTGIDKVKGDLRSMLDGGFTWTKTQDETAPSKDLSTEETEIYENLFKLKHIQTSTADTLRKQALDEDHRRYSKFVREQQRNQGASSIPRNAIDKSQRARKTTRPSVNPLGLCKSDSCVDGRSCSSFFVEVDSIIGHTDDEKD